MVIHQLHVPNGVITLNIPMVMSICLGCNSKECMSNTMPVYFVLCPGVEFAHVESSGITNTHLGWAMISLGGIMGAISFYLSRKEGIGPCLSV